MRAASRPAPSDALVLFGVTGDLAHKMIFPALYAMAKRGALTVPVVGVASRKWTLRQLHEHATDGIRKAVGRIDDRRALNHVLSLIRYVNGDYNDPGTFTALKQALGRARRPAHYLAIPPSLFEVVIKSLGATGLAEQARVIVEKPFGRDLASARELNRVARSVFPEDVQAERPATMAIVAATMKSFMTRSPLIRAEATHRRPKRFRFRRGPCCAGRQRRHRQLRRQRLRVRPAQVMDRLQP